jgi:hypothetical protein
VDTLTAAMVASRTGASGRTIRRWLNSGKLAGTRTIDGWSIQAADLDSFVASRSHKLAVPDGQALSLAVLAANVQRLTERIAVLEARQHALPDAASAAQDAHQPTEPPLEVSAASPTRTGVLGRLWSILRAS